MSADFTQAKQAIQDAINTINSYIQSLLSDILKWRLNRVNANKAVLSAFRTKVLESWQLNYEQIEMHGKRVGLRKGSLAPARASLPKLSFNYNAEVGGKMSLNIEEGTIDVPSVPVFIYEQVATPKMIRDLTAESSRQVIVVRIPYDVDTETPDFEDANFKYFSIPFSESVLVDLQETDYDGKTIMVSGQLLTLHTFKYNNIYTFNRDITIGGYNYGFTVQVKHGTWNVDAEYYTGTTKNVDIEALLITCVTSYTEDFNWVIGGRVFGRGQETALGTYKKDLALIVWMATYHIIELN